MVTVRRLSSVVSGVWEKAKEHFATAAQGATADSAIQGVKVNGTDLSKDSNNNVDVPVPTAFTDTPLKDGTASAGSSSQWARGDHVHPTDDSREAVANKVQSIDDSSTTEYPSSKAVADFVNSSVATNTATFLGNFSLADLGLTYPATEVQIATALDGHTWPTGVTPTNNDYVYVEIQDPQSTIDDKVQRYKYRDVLASWGYEYTLNNSSFTAEEKAAIDSGITSQDVTNLRADHTTLDTHIANTNNPHSVTKSQVGLGSVVNTGDSATPVSGGTTKFTTGGAYTELAKKVDKETGKGLSANDFTNTYKTKLDSIASGAEVNVQSDWNQSDSTKDDYIKNKPNLATVATSGSYNDLSNKPTIPAAQVNSNWNATSGVAKILNKPSLATVATSGSYNDLSNKPSIPAAANNGVLTITQNGTSKGTFSANQSGNNTIALTDTTYSAGVGLAIDENHSITNQGVRNVDWSSDQKALRTISGINTTNYVTVGNATYAANAESGSTLEAQVNKGLKAYKESIEWVKSIQGYVSSTGSSPQTFTFEIGDRSAATNDQAGVRTTIGLEASGSGGSLTLSMSFGPDPWAFWTAWLARNGVALSSFTSTYGAVGTTPDADLTSEEAVFDFPTGGTQKYATIPVGNGPNPSYETRAYVHGMVKFTGGTGSSRNTGILTLDLVYETGLATAYVWGTAKWMIVQDHA